MKKKVLPVVLSTAFLAPMFSPDVSLADSISEKSLDASIKVNSKNDVKSAIKLIPGNKAVKKNLDQYVITEVEKDAQGFSHYTLVPEVKGVKALGTEVKVHADSAGNVTFVNGDLDQARLAPTNTVKLSKDAAIDAAFKAAGVTRSEVKNFNNREVVKYANQSINPETNKFVYDIRLIYVSPEVATWDIQIDAETGAVVRKQNMAEAESYGVADSAIGNDGTSAAARGIGTRGSYRPITVFKSNYDNRYWLSNQSNKTLIETYDLFDTDVQRWQVMSADNTIFRSDRLKSAIDAHYYAEVVYKYYKDVHGRESYDNMASPLYSLVHWKYKENNAYWTGEAMLYGDGDGNEFGPLSQANDIIAHELTHGITFNTAGLQYSNESGALNESFSDVMAYFIDPDWECGEDAYTPKIDNDGGLRSMKEPTKFNQPDHYKNYVKMPNTENGDFGGVHVNSGIPNKAFYNTIAVEGMTADKAQHVYYKALTKYLTKYSNFADCKRALMRSAKDLYGTEAEQQVKRAWDSIGVI